MTVQYTMTPTNRMDLISWLRQGKVQRVLDALENLNPKELPLITGEPVGWHTQFGNITAADVTDEMADELNKTTHESSSRKEIIAAAYNAVIKHKGDTK